MIIYIFYLDTFLFIYTFIYLRKISFKLIIFFENRFVAMHYAATVFPSDDVPSRYLLLLASGDDKHEIRTEAIKVLYGTTHKNECDKQNCNHISLPDFKKLVTYIYSKMQARMSTSNEKMNIENKILPYNITVFTEVINSVKKIIYFYQKLYVFLIIK